MPSFKCTEAPFLHLLEDLVADAVSKPLLLHGLPIFIGDTLRVIEDIAFSLKDVRLKCRVGQRCSSPMESDCQFFEVPFGDLVTWTSSSSGNNAALSSLSFDTNTLYADYIYLMDDKYDSIRKLLNWWCLGFDGDLSARHSTLWCGSYGSYTHLHYDSYGYNIVHQIYGTKVWILMPPTETDCLYATRMPFEESTVYSQVDVLHPDYNRFPLLRQVSKVYLVRLSPGQTLYVPRHWWHFVYTDSPLSISVNLWVGLDKLDNWQRVTESMSSLMSKCVYSNPMLDKSTSWKYRDESSRQWKHFSNSSTVSSLSSDFHVLSLAINAVKTDELPDLSAASLTDICSCKGCSTSDHELILDYKNSVKNLCSKISPEILPPISTFFDSAEFRKFHSDCERSNSNSSISDKCAGNCYQNEQVTRLMNAFLHPDVLDVVLQQYLLQQHK